MLFMHIAVTIGLIGVILSRLARRLGFSRFNARATRCVRRGEGRVRHGNYLLDFRRDVRSLLYRSSSCADVKKKHLCRLSQHG